jgi:uncharacterized protein (DUF58 family)
MRAALTHGLRDSTARWLFRLKGAEPGEVVLGQRRVFILPTRAGLGFALLLILLFIGAVNYNLAMGLALTFFLTSAALVAIHLTFRNLAYLHLAPGRANPVHAGEEAQFELHLANRRRHGRYAVWVGFTGDDVPRREHPFDIASEGACLVTLQAPAVRRGWLDAPRIKLHTSFPLGLLRAWSYWHPAQRVLVYPHPEEHAPALPTVDALQSDDHGAGGQDDFAGVRAYQAGDSMKRLAWRQIARLGRDGALVSKHFEGGAASEMRIDFASLPASMDIETRLSRLTRWVIEAEACNLPYAFRLGGLSFPAALGGTHREACLRALALYGIDP